MPDASVQTAQLHDWLARAQAGDQTAWNELYRRVGGRLEQLAHTMLARFPNVRRWVETGDVLQNAVVH